MKKKKKGFYNNNAGLVLIVMLMMLYTTTLSRQFLWLQQQEEEEEVSPFLSFPSHGGSSSGSTPPKFLLGIFTHNLYQKERDRRQMIRDTYLKYYYTATESNNNNNMTICSMTRVHPDCQLAYMFVMGIPPPPPPSSSSSSLLQNNGNRTEFLTATTTQEMTLTNKDYVAMNQRLELENNTDILILNIIENGEYGKSTTWLRYATLWIQEQQHALTKHHNNVVFHPDYIIKTDSDTMLIPHRFFRFVQEQEESLLRLQQQHKQQQHQQDDFKRQRIYGGVAMDRKTCGYPQHDHCRQLQAPVYMGGALYFMSVDLADYVTSPYCPRTKLFLPHEDMAMANYIFSMIAATKNGNHENNNNNNNTITVFDHPDAYLNTWKHPIKEPKRMKTLWRKFLSKQQERQKRNNNNKNTFRQPAP